MPYLIFALVFFLPLEANAPWAPIRAQASVPIVEQTATTTEEVVESDLCSCVQYVKRFGIYLGMDARDVESNASWRDVREGDLALFQYGEVYHVAYIYKKTDEYLSVREGNKIRCEETFRTIHANDENLTGFYRP